MSEEALFGQNSGCVHVVLDIGGDIQRLLLFVSQTVRRLFQIDKAPDRSNYRNDSKDEESTRLPNRAVHHWLNCQGQYKDHGVARGAHESQRCIHGYLTAIEPGDCARRVLEAEKE